MLIAMKQRMTTTGMVVTGTAIFIAIYDAIAIHTKGIEASVSVFLQDTVLMSPAVSISIGVLIGHLFAYMQPRPPNRGGTQNDSRESTESNRE